MGSIIIFAASVLAGLVLTAVTMIEAGAAVEVSAVRKISKAEELQAVKLRQLAVDEGFDAFKKKTFRENRPGGVYIVNGDTPIINDEELEIFFRTQFEGYRLPLFMRNGYGPKGIFDAIRGQPNIWNNVLKKNLSYCVSRAFGKNYDAVVKAMSDAARAWESVADVKFKHMRSFDDECPTNGPLLLFDVSPIDTAPYYARAFFPNSPREQSNVLIHSTAFGKMEDGVSLVGLMRHELGHILGFRHEHIRPEAGACFEREDYVPAGPYDGLSVMHYPSCNGKGDGSMTLSEEDKRSVACIYGAAVGYALNPDSCTLR